MKMSERIVELEKEIEKLNSEIYNKNRKIMDLEEKVSDMNYTLEMSDNRLKDVGNYRLYLEGQVEVLKRVSGLYNEEIPTHNEFKQKGREILSSVYLPF